MINLDEAIKHCIEVAEDRAIKALEQQPTTKNVLNQLKDEIHDKATIGNI